ncbi:MAG: AEC family transporter [Erysipelotrichales bacterium]|nr:AEC family transporter [Erysipelotrichales bacterium]
MENLLYALNTVLPLVLLVILGYFLRKIKFVNDNFLTIANKFVFKIGIPALLFKNVYDSSFSNISLGYILFIVLSMIGIFFIGLIFVLVFLKDKSKKGTILQALVRPNYALIGLPLVMMIFNELSSMYNETVTLVALVSAFVIPLANTLAVIALSIFQNEHDESKSRIKTTLINIVKNPLIQAVVLGLLFSIGREVLNINSYILRDNFSFIYKAISYIASTASPIALIVVGARFYFSGTKKLKKYILITTIMRSIVTPLLVFGVAILFFDFLPSEYAVLFAAFASPVAVSSVPVVEQMKGDSELAGQIVVWTTLISPFTVVLLLYILKTLAYI